MIRTGIVEICEGNSVTVVLADASCDGCSTPCGACNRRGKVQRITLDNTPGACVGDRVELSCSDGYLVLGAICFFLLPLIVGIGSFWGLSARLQEGLCALVATLSALLSVFLFSCLFSLGGIRRKNRFVLTRILASASGEKELDKH